MSQTIAKLYPLANRVVIKRAESAVRSKGGIVLPEDKKTRLLRGTVVAVGPGQVNNEGERMPLSVKVGDDVILPDYGGTKLEIDEQKDLYVFREPDILARIAQ
ncbi:hypothetical protein WA026_014580 [Henosepilachna vigintioctopunctata]|uniref:10 kDa heat shock protein, mitochondrial n=1 Tax=Henosepilachna vigintioctopunctata TaxID=420089 RepID=A0AAW1VEJ9_9CUCU